ncbi:helix-turn-helix domain-containing protein [Pseudomonas silvicola]|nr:helix-turn-helix domain-containing protein [Pseudomonas silvicola]
MDIKQAFGAALRARRQASGLTQEDFSEISSRTYLSTLERGIKCPTLEKVVELASVLKVHPLTLMTEAFLAANSSLTLTSLLEIIREETRGAADLC